MIFPKQALKKVKVLGYPFAGGQPRGGVELTPTWFKSQKWFKDLQNVHRVPVVYEEVPVTSGFCNAFHFDPSTDGAKKHEILEAKNIENVIQSSLNLKNATVRAIKEGYFPVVLGGDHSQAMGSLAGYKKMFPDGRIIWIDAHIDANTPSSSPSGNAHGMPLAFLSGQVPKYRNMKCVDMDKDVCYFGIRSFEDEEVKFIQDNKVLVFESQTCHPTDQRMTEIHQEIYSYFKGKSNFR
jgi:arginase